jgi:hypothetical protein
MRHGISANGQLERVSLSDPRPATVNPEEEEEEEEKTLAKHAKPAKGRLKT